MVEGNKCCRSDLQGLKSHTVMLNVTQQLNASKFHEYLIVNSSNNFTHGLVIGLKYTKIYCQTVVGYV